MDDYICSGVNEEESLPRLREDDNDGLTTEQITELIDLIKDLCSMLGDGDL